MIELELNSAQLEIYNRKLAFVRQNMRGMLDEDDVARICHQCDFDEKAIDDKLSSYKTESKYAGLQEFEWQTTQTRAEKEAAKRRKIEEMEQKRLQRERRQIYLEKQQERERRQAERLAKQEARE